MNINTFLLFKGNSMSWLVSLLHFRSMVCAVRYDFQVLWATPRLPNSAMAAAVSLGRFKWPKNSLVQAPLVPYFFVPFAGVGVNLEPKYEILFYWRLGLMPALVSSELRVVSRPVKVCRVRVLLYHLPDMSAVLSAGGAGQAIPTGFEDSSRGLLRIFAHFSRTAAPSW